MKLTISLQVDPGFTRGGWAMRGGEAAAHYILDTWQRPDAFLLGRKTFDLFATFWGARSDDDSFGEAISSKPKYVVSNHLTDPAWEHSTVISGDVASEISKLKQQPGGELLVVGSAALARWLLENELVDEINLVQFPVIIGEGERLFPRDGRDFGLELLDTKVFDTGVIGLTYRVAGRPENA
jgi:dihydrofolate reductase